jgi:hypothetical protein
LFGLLSAELQKELMPARARKTNANFEADLPLKEEQAAFKLTD